MLGHADDSRIPSDYQAIVIEAKRQGKLLELNNNSLTPHRPNSTDGLIAYAKLCKCYDMPVCVSSDAHYHTMVGNVAPLMQLMREIDFPFELIVNMTKESFENYLKSRATRIKGS